MISSYADIDTKIIKDEKVPKSRRYAIVVFMVLVGLASILAFVFDTVRFTKLKWLKYGLKDAKIVYILSIVLIVIFLICTISFILFVIISFCKDKSTSFIFMLFNITSWAGLILTFIAFFNTVKSNQLDIFGNPIRCSAVYNATYYGALEKLTSQKFYDFMQWYRFKRFDICSDTLGIVLIIAILHFILYIVLVSVICGCCCCPQDKDKVENEYSNEASANDPPNQNNDNINNEYYQNP